MSGAERRLLVETVVDQAAGRVPVVAQTGAVSTREAVELSRHAESVGASVLMVVAPYYEPLTLDETLTYLRTVADAVSLPIMLYNLPVATGVNLSADVVGALAAEVDNIRYIKDTSADMAQAGQLIHNYGDVISTFVGWDSLLLMALTEGAAGVMAGTANVFPGHLVSIHRALLAGDAERARREWDRLYPLDERDHVGPVHPGRQVGPERPRLPHRKLSQTHSRARPRDRREHRRAGDVASAAVRRAVTRTAPDYRPASTNFWRYP